MLDLKIKFPIWVINSDNIWEQDGIIFIDDKVLDDRNQKGDTVGKRRLQTPLKNLFNLKFQIDDYIGLIKHRGKNYVDSGGKHIYYEKTKYTPLKCHKIMRVEDHLLSSTVWLKDITFSFKVKRPPTSRKSWAQVLYLNGLPWLIYDYLEQKVEDTRRKV